MKLLLYDVETANAKNVGSICSVGWILVENDLEIDSGYSLINPNCPFSKVNVSVHGITSDDVKDSPCFCDYWQRVLAPMMNDCLVVSHNADFDMSATEQALYASGVADTGIYYFDTLSMFKALVDADSYKLSSLAAASGYLYNPHNALEDVRALLFTMQYLRDQLHCSDLTSMIVRSCVPAKNTLTNNYVPHPISDVKRKYPIYTRCTEDVTVRNHSFSGMKICITGDVGSYDRADIERMIKERDGRMTTAVSGKTDLLVVGTYDQREPGYVSGKHQSALDIIARGGKIRIISSEEFIKLLEES